MWRWCQQFVRSTLLRIPTLSRPRLPSKFLLSLPPIDKYFKNLDSPTNTRSQDVTSPPFNMHELFQPTSRQRPELTKRTTIRTKTAVDRTKKPRIPKLGQTILLDDSDPKVVARRRSRMIRKFDTVASSISSTPLDHSTVVALRRFLTGSLHPSGFGTLAPRDIRALFYSLKERNLLRHLSEDDYTKLIALFGFLSASRHATVRSGGSTPPFVTDTILRLSRNLTKEARTYWDFVGVLGREREKLGVPLSHSDRYWIMRRMLADVMAGSRAKNDVIGEIPDTIKRSMNRARAHYRVIASSYPHPEVHLPFFRTLLSLGLVEEVVFRWISMMKNQVQTHPSLKEFAWKIILRAAESLTPESKEKLIESIKSPFVAPPFAPSHAEPEMEFLSNTSETPNLGWQLGDLTRLILSYLSDPHATLLPPHLIHWVPQLVSQNVLTPDTQTVLKNLYTLALVTTPASSSNRSSAVSSTSSSEWGFICALALCERVVGVQGRVAVPLHEGLAEQLGSVALHLWGNWDTQRNGLPVVVNLALLASFTYLAGRTRNTQLLDLCLYEVKTLPRFILESPEHSSSVYHLVAELTIARMLHGEQTSVAIRSLQEYLDRTGNAADALSLVAIRFCDVHPMLAHQIDTIAGQSLVSLSTEAYHKMALVLADKGEVKLAYSHVRVGKLPKKQRAQVLEVIAKAINTHRISIGWELAGLLAADMRRTFRQYLPSEPLQGDLQEALWVIMNAGRPREAISVIRGISVIKKDYFDPNYISRLIHTLTRRRQFQLSKILFTTFRQQYPSYASRWYDFLLEKFHQAGAIDQWRMLRKYRWTLPDRDMWNETLYQHGRVCRTEARQLGYIVNSKSVPLRYHGRWMKLMLNSRVRRQSRMLYYRNQSRYTPRLRTRMANDLIESIFRSNTNHPRGHLRILLETMHEVHTHSDFTPDRVTFNIIMKGLLRLDLDFDAPAIRTLFNHIIKSGYPNGGLGEPGQPIFLHDTAEALEAIKRFQLPVLDEKLSYERHVRPLYKMFVTALYVRGDIFGAKRVLSVLKRVRHQEKGRKRRRWLRRMTDPVEVP